MSSEIYLHVKKDEYLNKLKNITTNLYLQGIKAIYSFTIENNKIHKNLLKEFQANLKDIAQWTDDDIITEYERFIIISKYKNLDKLIFAIFKINVTICNNKKVETFKYPKPYEYMHQCYLNIARIIWKEPYLF